MKILIENKAEVIEQLSKWGCVLEEYDAYPIEESSSVKKPITNTVTYICDGYFYTAEEIYDTLEKTNENAILWSCCGVEVTGEYRDMMLCPQCKEHL